MCARARACVQARVWRRRSSVGRELNPIKHKTNAIQTHARPPKRHRIVATLVPTSREGSARVAGERRGGSSSYRAEECVAQRACQGVEKGHARYRHAHLRNQNWLRFSYVFIFSQPRQIDATSAAQADSACSSAGNPNTQANAARLAHTDGQIKKHRKHMLPHSTATFPTDKAPTAAKQALNRPAGKRTSCRPRRSVRCCGGRQENSGQTLRWNTNE
jgi:hypothetical protein